MPGFGNTYSTTFTAVSTNSVGSDIFDLSHCVMVGISLSSNSTGAATSNIVQLQQTFNPGATTPGWVNVASAITGASAGVYSSTLAPFGVCRLMGSCANGTLT